jgi:thiamine-monophosphate kinase
VFAAAVPLSIPAERWVRNGGDVRRLFSGGDDYLVLFSAAPEDRDAIAASDPSGELRLCRVGYVEAAKGVVIEGSDGRALIFEGAGYAHHLGC